MRKNKENMEEVKVIPPVPGACPICATVHKPEQPHDRDSLYYQNYFRRKYRRIPTWNDAMSHCSDSVKKSFTEKLARRGIIIDVTERE